jgi:hypothetical protein
MDYDEIRSAVMFLDMVTKAGTAIAFLILASNVRIVINIRRKVKNDKQSK